MCASIEPQDLATMVAAVITATLSELGLTKDPPPLKKVRKPPWNLKGHPARTKSLSKMIRSWNVIHCWTVFYFQLRRDSSALASDY